MSPNMVGLTLWLVIIAMSGVGAFMLWSLAQDNRRIHREAVNVDQIIDLGQEECRRLCLEHHLSQPAIERWRWDERVITLSWSGGDFIQRKISVSDKNGEAVVEVDAWQDGHYRRSWRHREVVRIPLPLDPTVFKTAMDGAFLVVSRWGATDLTGEEVLFSKK